MTLWAVLGGGGGDIPGGGQDIHLELYILTNKITTLGTEMFRLTHPTTYTFAFLSSMWSRTAVKCSENAPPVAKTF